MSRHLTITAAALALASTTVACGSSRGAEPVASRANHSFKSAPAPNAPAIVWAVGDGADGSAAAKAMASRIERGRPDRFVYLGDVYQSGSAAEFRNHYATVYGGLAAVTDPTPGNHEWGARQEGYEPYWRRRTGAPPPPWYTLRIGGWRLISLNSEAPHDEGSRQQRWLVRTLRNGRGNCVLAFWHRPLQSAGLHGDQADVAPLWNALRGRARLVLNGHDHDLQRFHPRDGITELVAGAGGQALYPVRSSDTRLAFADERHRGALRIALRPGAADVSVVASGGTRLDHSRVTCRPAT